MIIYLSAHLISRIKERFGITDSEKMFIFIKESLSNCKVQEKQEHKIFLINEENGTIFRGFKINDNFILKTVYPIEQCSYFVIRETNFDRLKTKDYSKVSIIFANQNLHEKNILK